jgi:hypothetical protein
MISILKKQSVPEHPELEVVSDTGGYNDTDLILCAKVGETEAVAQFEAKFIKYGNSAYDGEIII